MISQLGQLAKNISQIAIKLSFPSQVIFLVIKRLK